MHHYHCPMPVTPATKRALTTCVNAGRRTGAGQHKTVSRDFPGNLAGGRPASPNSLDNRAPTRRSGRQRICSHRLSRCVITGRSALDPRCLNGDWAGLYGAVACSYCTGVGRSAVATGVGGVHGFPAALTSFIGRAEPVRDVARLLEEYRLVTVTGPGGSGKTRLADQVARLVAGRFADEVWLAELAAVRNPGASGGGGSRGAGDTGAAGVAAGRGVGSSAGPAAVAACPG